MDPFRTPPIGRGPDYTFTGAGPHLVHADGDPIVFSSDLVPNADGTLDIGSSSSRVKTVFAKALTTGASAFSATSSLGAGNGSTNYIWNTGAITRTAGLLFDIQNSSTSMFNVDPSGQLSAAVDTDTESSFGRVSLHSSTTDTARFSHYDLRASTTDMALSQTDVGATILGAANNKSITMTQGGTARWKIDSSGDLLCGVDAAHDIGAAANRINDLYMAGNIELSEMTAPGVAPANGARLYIDDTGGKTQLMVIFATGSAIQLAVEA